VQNYAHNGNALDRCAPAQLFIVQKMNLLEQSRNYVRRFSKEVAFYKRVLKHPRTPRVSKFFLGAAIAYAVSPIDLIPDFIPVIGYLDDLIIVPILIWVAIRFIPKNVMIECGEENQESI
jgi:uncharacterized membrane protein YkvA (DUF1232 family)